MESVKREQTIKNSEYFIQKTRADGTTFLYCNEDSPEELRQFIQKVHVDHFFGVFPNDWIYGTIADAFQDLEDNGNDIDTVCYEPNIYNHQLFNWLYENGNAFASEFCNDWLSVYSDNQSNDIVAAISGGQYLAMDAIYRAVNEYLKEQNEVCSE
jgi:hypothetical protein